MAVYRNCYYETHKKKLRFALIFSTGVSIALLSACGSTAPATDKNKSPQTSETTQIKTGDVPKSAMSRRLDSAVSNAINKADSTQNHQEAISIYKELITLRPNDPDISTRYARVLRNNGQFQEAKKIIQPFATGDKRYAGAITELSMLHLSEGKFKDAELRAREALEMEENNGRAYLALGTALDAQKFYEQAETAFRRGIEYWEGDPAPILNNLALNLASQGKLDQALAILERARNESPHRMEIERNYRIISTLKESVGSPAPRPSLKPRSKSDISEQKPIQENSEVQSASTQKPQVAEIKNEKIVPDNQPQPSVSEVRDLRQNWNRTPN